MVSKVNIAFHKTVFIIYMAFIIFVAGVLGTPTIAHAAGELVIVPNASEQTVTLAVNQSVYIAPNIELRSFGYNLSSAKLVIENLPNDATTSYSAVAGLTVSYDSSKTVYTITGTANAIDYQTLFRSFRINCGATLQNNIKFSFLVSANTTTPMYYSGTGHYYEYISSPTISWTSANTAASARIYNGMEGYLVTITSAGENAFVVNKMAGSGWIGASDAALNNRWVWAAGPETGTQFWQGLDAGNGGYAVGGSYTNWLAGEPNNDGGLGDYAHIFVNSPGWEYATSTWNDMPNSNTFVQGYTVEYGGMSGDAPEDLSETVTIHIGAVIRYPQTGDNHGYIGNLWMLSATALIGICVITFIAPKKKSN